MTQNQMNSWKAFELLDSRDWIQDRLDAFDLLYHFQSMGKVKTFASSYNSNHNNPKYEQ